MALIQRMGCIGRNGAILVYEKTTIHQGTRCLTCDGCYRCHCRCHPLGMSFAVIHVSTLSLRRANRCVSQYAYAQRNRVRERGDEDDKLAGKTDEEIDEMGDDSPKFRYVA